MRDSAVHLDLGAKLDEDLKKSFRKFKIIKINNQEALRKARLKLPFKIKPADKELQFILRLNDIRSSEYTAEYTDNTGRHNLPRSDVFTYKSKIIGERNSVVALTVDGRKFEGYLLLRMKNFLSNQPKDTQPVLRKMIKSFIKPKIKLLQMTEFVV